MKEELEKVRKAIRDKGAKWKAEKTSVSELTAQEKRERLGLILTDEELEDAKKREKACPRA